ncbi:MAG TPA: thrombospondin type 3 repeat-containing protein [Candidatus Polarisedimenticolaceae bacterium]|nr:thrombospondin type 3 repeat-containing protein [Candidatus Polarisedimenticolaceae bacterium]
MHRRWPIAPALLVAALGWLGGPAQAGNVVITEIMYHPASDQPGDEFIEIHNRGGTTVTLDNWCFDGVQFCFPVGASIPAGAYRVLTGDATRFQTTYGFAPDWVYTLTLANDGEDLILRDAALAVQDEVPYQDAPPWPTKADGLGPSLEVIDPAQDNSTARDWRASTAGPGHTARAQNSVNATGLPAWIENVTFASPPPASSPILVTARVTAGTTVSLFYKLGFAGTESSLTMLDNGASGDGAAGDLVYGASIPAQPADTLVRLRIVVTGPSGPMSYPRTDDTVIYDGTVVADAALSSNLPIFHWYIDPIDYNDALNHRFTDQTEPAMLFYAGKFYDGIQVRIRGQSSRDFPKPHWHFYMPVGHNFQAPGLISRAVNSFRLQGNYADKSALRELLANETMRDAGVPSFTEFHVRVEKNGSFFGLFTYGEDNDSDHLRRVGIDETGAYYKADDDLKQVATANDLLPHYEKVTRLGENYNDLFDFTTKLNTYSGTQLHDWLQDNVDVPSMLDYIAAQTIVHNNDHVSKNYYMYRDSNATLRWRMLPWDLDLTFGRNFFAGTSLNDVLWADVDVLPGQPATVSPSHPLFGTSARQKWGGVWNLLIDRVLIQPDFKEMYVRRLRTLIDQLFEQNRYEARIDQLAALIAPEHALDRLAWPAYGQPQDLTTAVNLLKNEYLQKRRVHLFVTHGVCDLPPSQSAAPRVVINELMYKPTGGIDQEFVELYNPSLSESVDLSNWRLDGVALTIPPGTVILPNSYLVVVRNDTVFRALYPGMFGTGKFVAAQYGGSLSDVGESIVLRNRLGAVVSAVTFDDAVPWAAGANGGGKSLELIDPSKDVSKVANWTASLPAGGTPGLVNSVRATIPALAALYINEVLASNATINVDEASQHDPWVELYNASSQTIDLSGKFLSSSFALPTQWPFPAGTTICAHCYKLVWADTQTGQGPLHANFTLSPAGGSVVLFETGGRILDYLTYPALQTDYAFGRFPDGNAEQRVFSIVTPVAANNVPASPLLLNEYNAVSPANLLANGNADTYWGRVAGNGGDWFELVVTQDHLDVRGWQLVISNDTGGPTQTIQPLTLSSNALWSNLRAGTVITVSESLPDDVSYSPVGNDWWINVRAAAGGSGTYITAQDFEVSNTNWQLTIKDGLGVVRFGPAGEGIQPLTGVGGDEVFKLEEDPTPYLTPIAEYNDGTSSTFGAPNIFAAGTLSQDFTTLRAIGLTGTCVNPDADGDLVCDSVDNCPSVSNPAQTDADADGVGDACDPCPGDSANDADADTVCGNVDNCPMVANTNQADGDGDTIGTVCDNCPSNSNVSQADADGDNVGDACDACPNDPINDPDGDGVCRTTDNCPGAANPSQANADGDTFGDACDPCPVDAANDIDLDGLCANADNCPLYPNPSQANADGDSRGDPCDNCPTNSNSTQLNTDGDSLGDACDTDDDNDGVLDGSDNCPLVPNATQTDSSSPTNGIGDACETDDDTDGVPDASDNCPTVSNAAQTDGDGDGAGNSCDCAATTKGVSTTPAQVGESLRLDKVSGTTLRWKRGPQGHVSNVYRGSFTSAATWAYNETCLAGALATLQTIDAANPAVGTAFFYLVSGRNICGEGPAGINTQGTAIVPTTACGTSSTDTDADTVQDAADNCPNNSNSTQTDTDRDFVGDICDNCSAASNPNQADNDGDAAGDVCDTDDDNDGVLDGADNCSTVSNSNQANADGDTAGDVCDTCTDTDHDGRGNSGYPANRCNGDLFPNDPFNDADRDGIGGDIDNCPTSANTSQLDTDGDGIGDTCDDCPRDPDNDVDNDDVCGGDCDSVGIELLEFASPDEVQFVGFGSPIRYKANEVDPGLGLTWVTEAFNHTSWPTGTYGIGYDAEPNGAQALLQTTVPVSTLSLYTRAQFNIADVSTVHDLFLGADYDDAWVAWINGIEVYRSPEMPAGTPAWNTNPAAHESSNDTQPNYFPMHDISALGIAALHTGTNVLAVGVWNWTPPQPPSTDLVLVPRLTSNRTKTMSYLRNASDPGLGTTWTGEAFNDTSWTDGLYGVGFDLQGQAVGLLQTTVPDGANSIYTRARFNVPEVSFVSHLYLAADYDDGFVAWINGTEVLRSPSMPAGTPAWNTPAGDHEASNASTPVFDPPYDVSLAGIPALHNGTNVLAIGVWNINAASSDLVLWPQLSSNGVAVDNCPATANSSQVDTDHDGLGDSCDNCPLTFNPVQSDVDHDGLGDACDP